jgi:hypothetical protein
VGAEGVHFDGEPLGAPEEVDLYGRPVVDDQRRVNFGAGQVGCPAEREETLLEIAFGERRAAGSVVLVCTSIPGRERADRPAAEASVVARLSGRRFHSAAAERWERRADGP